MNGLPPPATPVSADALMRCFHVGAAVQDSQDSAKKCQKNALST